MYKCRVCGLVANKENVSVHSELEAASESLDNCVTCCAPVLIYFRVNSAPVLASAFFSRLISLRLFFSEWV